MLLGHFHSRKIRNYLLCAKTYQNLASSEDTTGIISGLFEEITMRESLAQSFIFGQIDERINSSQGVKIKEISKL